jgi:regulator of sigma E protease
VNGDPVVGDAEFRAAIAASNGNPVRLTVLTPGSGAVRDVDVTPRVVEGGLRLGVSPAIRWPSAGILATAAAAAVNCLGESERTLMALAALVRREPGVDVGGPVAIVADMKDKIALGYRYYVRILASLSVSLGLFNLLPVPGLDGIKMVWLTIEGVVRRNINLKMQEVVNAIGVVLLLVLMLGLTVRDGMRLFG